MFCSEVAREDLYAMDPSMFHKQCMWFSVGLGKGLWKEQVAKG